MLAVHLHVQHGISWLLHRYADWRIGATVAEKRCHKPTESVLITFDDYGSEREVRDILAILARKEVKGMFFLIGEWADKHPELVRRIQAAGHVLGNHTYTHPNLLTLPDASLVKEIEHGLPGPWLRAPQGRANKRVRAVAQQLGYKLCYWTIDSRDWTGASAASMRHTILSEMHPGAVILFHLHGKHTRELLPGIIDDIRASGYTLTGTDEVW